MTWPREGSRETDEGIIVSEAMDWCRSPTAIVPYRLYAYQREATNLADSVRQTDDRTHVKDSVILKSYGDEPGVGGGVISGTHNAECTPKTWSESVRAEGRNVVRHDDEWWMNHKNTWGRLNYQKDMSQYGMPTPSTITPTMAPPDASLYEASYTGNAAGDTSAEAGSQGAPSAAGQQYAQEFILPEVNPAYLDPEFAAPEEVPAPQLQPEPIEPPKVPETETPTQPKPSPKPPYPPAPGFRTTGKEDKKKVLCHYTSERGMQGILTSQQIMPSLQAVNPNDARYGDGQYFSDIMPGTLSNAQLSRAFINNPFQGNRFSNYVCIDVSGLHVVQGRPNVFVVPNSGPLSIQGRLVGSGAN